MIRTGQRYIVYIHDQIISLWVTLKPARTPRCGAVKRPQQADGEVRSAHVKRQKDSVS
jgi:hypothetical protein